MAIVELNDNQWGQVMSILADAPWKVANPLLMEMGNQLRAQMQAASNPPNIAMPSEARGNSQESPS
jgi:hypothetical protein